MINRYASLRQGLVGCWIPSLGASGFRLIDRSGNGNHGTLTGMDPGTDWVPSGGKLALDFDGVDDFVSLGSPQALANANVSISIWIKPSSIVGYRLIYGVGNFPKLYIDPNGRIVLYDKASANTVLTNNVWSHVVATSGGVNVRYFLNGIADGVVAGGAFSTSPSIVTIGKDPGSNSQFFVGQLDDIRIYNRALTPQEIRLLYTGGRGVGLLPERIKHRRKTSGTNRRRRLICGANC